MFLPKSQRVLTPAERVVLVWLLENKNHTSLDIGSSGKPHFTGYVLDSPRCQAATFLSLLCCDLIEAEAGYGPPPSVKARDDGEEPERLEDGANIVRLRQAGWRTALAKWFFNLSQMISTDQAAVEPHGFALVLVGRGKVEVLHWGLSALERSQAASAMLRHHAPGTLGWARSYRISERGKIYLRAAEMEDRIDASPHWAEQDQIRQERWALLQSMPRMASQSYRDASKDETGL